MNIRLYAVRLDRALGEAETAALAHFLPSERKVRSDRTAHTAETLCAYALLRRALHSEELRREYRALARGRVTPPRGVIDAPIARAEGSLVKRCVAPDGLPSRTEYEVLSYHGELTLLRLAPRTGRTHQLRVHMASLGHPLAGDWLYGTEDRALIARPALHSYALWFTHPLTHAVLHFTAPLPEDMERLIK